jgi:hypothetical protein
LYLPCLTVMPLETPQLHIFFTIYIIGHLSQYSDCGHWGTQASYSMGTGEISPWCKAVELV